jgi:hypothetical protein
MSHGRVEFYEEQSPLRRTHWVFWFGERYHALVLDGYAIEERSSPRHKFKVVAYYERIHGSHSHPSIREEDVPLTTEIIVRAIDRFMDGLRVVKWSEIRG